MNEEQDGNEEVIESLDDYTKRIQELTNDQIYIFRGHSNEFWSPESAAQRRIRNSLRASYPSLDDNDITAENIGYHKNLINRARSKGHGYDEQSRPLHDLEILALLQHHGAATALIDCTNNPYVALWFATEGHQAPEAYQDAAPKESNGKVFAIINDVEKFSEVDESHFDPNSEKDISYFLAPERQLEPPVPSYWLWKAQRLRMHRIIRQSSVFVLGKPQIDDSDYKEIIISGNNKKGIRDELERLHDINEESLFPDFPGFAAANRTSKSYQIEYTESYKETKSYEELFRDGQKYFQSKEYESAINQYTRAINIHKYPPKIVAQAFCNRGRSYYATNEYNQAINDFKKAIETDPRFAPALYNLGIIYGSQKEYSLAIDKVNRTLEINPKYSGAKNFLSSLFFQRGIYRYMNKKKDWSEDLNTALRLAQEQGNAQFEAQIRAEIRECEIPDPGA